MPSGILALLLTLGLYATQSLGSWPEDYPGKPSGEFSPEWQAYFEVVQPLPNVSFPLGRSWAGNIPVNRPGHPNNTLFFWAFEKENGSLTAEDSTEPWGIWLNGGPGSSSMLGLFVENGPLHVGSDYSIHENEFSWNRLADYFWIDQPVGTGYSTADDDGYAADEDEMAIDFMNFLANLVEVFPSLKTRPLYLTGESYAGTFIPYITKAYFGMQDPPVNLVKIAIGNGVLGSFTEFNELSAMTLIETYPQLINYSPEAYNYFKEQTHLCGYDLNLTYPQNGRLPSVLPHNGDPTDAKRPAVSNHALLKELVRRDSEQEHRTEIDGEGLARREKLKRDSVLEGGNGTINPTWGCDILTVITLYAFEASAPWLGHDGRGFDVYYIPDALQPQAPADASVFLNNNQTRAALHAPSSVNFRQTISYPWKGNGADPSVEPMVFLDELAANATKRGVHVVIYSGNDDALVPHFGSEVAVQNTTFGGVQGFTRRPSTPWYGDDGSFAGIVHQERNWTYVLFKDTGHLVPQHQPANAFVFLREFVLGSNQTGLVTSAGGTTTVVGGEETTLAAGFLPGQLGIYIGSGATESTYTFPSATIAAWNNFLATATATAANEDNITMAQATRTGV